MINFGSMTGKFSKTGQKVMRLAINFAKGDCRFIAGRGISHRAERSVARSPLTAPFLVIESAQYGSLCFGSLNRYESQLCGSLKL